MRKILIASLLCWACWLWTLEPTVSTGDSGELTAAAYHVGVAHPPGYPIHTVLVRLVQWMPLGNIAFRSNVASSLISFFTLLVFGSTLLRVSRLWSADGWPLIAPLVVMAFGLSERVWAQAIETEVYATQSLFVAGMAGILVRAAIHPGWWWGAGVWLGMAMVHHPLSWFWAPFVAGWWWRSPTRRAFPLWLWPATIVLGWMWVMVLPLRSAAFPLMDWAHPVTVQGVLDQILRVNYGKISSTASAASLVPGQIAWWTGWLARQWPWWSWPLAVWGWWKLKERDRAAGFVSAAVWVTTSLVVLWALHAAPTPTASYLNQEFFVAPSLIFGIWIFIGVGYFGPWIADWGLKTPYSVLRTPSWAPTLLFGALVVAQLLHWPAGQNAIAYWYGVNVLSLVDANAVVFTAGDKGVIPLAYLSKVEGCRPDVRLLDDIGCVFENIYGPDYLSLSAEIQEGRKTATQQRVVESAGEKPVYAMEGSHLFRSVTAFTSYGLIQRAGRMAEGAAPPYEAALKRCWWNPEWDQSEDYIARDMAAEYHYLRAEWARTAGLTRLMKREWQAAERAAFDIPWVKNKIGRQLGDQGQDPAAAVRLAEESVRMDPSTPHGHNSLGMAYMDARQFDQAVSAFEKALAVDPYFVEAYSNLGNAYAARGETDRARKAYERALQLDPRHVRAHNNLGILLFRQNKFSESIPEFQEAVKLDPSYINAHSNLGAAYYKMGRTAEAIKEWEEVLRWDPHHVEARQNLNTVKP